MSNIADKSILMISIDRSLVGGKSSGDAIERHKEYGQHVKSLDIIVHTKSEDKFSKFNIADNVASYPTQSNSRLFFVSDALRIARKIYEQKKIDMIICQDPFLTGWVGYKLKKKYGTKLLVHSHGDFFDNKLWLKEQWYNRVLLLIAHKVLRNADGIRVMSQGIKNKLIKFGIKENIIRVIPTPVDLKKFFANGNIQNNSDKKIILSIGRLVTVKNFPLLIRAMQIVYQKRKDIILRIAGDGPEYDNLKKMTANLDYVQLLGFKDHNDLPEEYQKCDLFVLSSDSESFGKVLVEANSCGKPVIATATTGAKDIVKDGYNGFLVPIDDARGLADKILYLLDNSEKAKEMGENGRNLMKENFSDNTLQIVSFWENIIKNKL